MGKWTLAMNSDGCVEVKYVNRITGVIFDCGTAAKEQSIDMVRDWAISQADPGDTVVCEVSHVTLFVMHQPKQERQ